MKPNFSTFTGLKAGEKVILKIDDKCDTNASKFQVHEDGFIKHVATGLCLHVVNYHAAFKHQVLTLSKDCNTTDAKFDFIEPLPEGKFISCIVLTRGGCSGNTA